MKVLKTIEVKLTEEEIKKIIAEKVASELPDYTVKPEDVELLLGTRCVGYFTDEHVELYFKGGTVHCVIKEED